MQKRLKHLNTFRGTQDDQGQKAIDAILRTKAWHSATSRKREKIETLGLSLWVSLEIQYFILAVLRDLENKTLTGLNISEAEIGAATAPNKWAIFGVNIAVLVIVQLVILALMCVSLSLNPSHIERLIG